MRVGVVGRCLNSSHIRGMGRYVYELMGQLANEPALEWRVFGNDPSIPVKVPQDLRGEIDVFEFRGDRFELWEQIGLPRRARQFDVDVLHCTEGTVPYWQPVPTVMTLHDTMAWDGHDNSAKWRFYYNRLLPAAMARCAAIITISESSRRDIEAKWPHLAPKVVVIPHGIGNEYLTPLDNTPKSALQVELGTQPYLVYLGGPMERKRFSWAVQVLQATGQPSLHLVACGFGPADREAARARIPEELRTRVHFAPFLSDGELLSLYKQAAAVLYPTLYEGFGFPVVEAQAAGVPVVFSPVSSLAELVGPLSLLAELHDLEAWVAAVKSALAMSIEERTLRFDQARIWARGFSWTRSAEAHARVYRSAVQQQPVTNNGRR